MTRPVEWYDAGSQQCERAGRLGGEIHRHQRDFTDQDENAAWIDGVLDGVMSAGGRIAAVTSVPDMMPGSKGGLIQVVIVEEGTYDANHCKRCYDSTVFKA